MQTFESICSFLLASDITPKKSWTLPNTIISEKEVSNVYNSQEGTSTTSTISTIIYSNLMLNVLCSKGSTDINRGDKFPAKVQDVV